MLRSIVMGAVSIGVACFAMSSHVAAITSDYPPSEYLSPVFISAFQTSNVDSATTKLDVIELYNSTTEPINLKNWVVDGYGSSEISACKLTISHDDEYILPKSYVVLAQSSVLQGSMEPPMIKEFDTNCGTIGQKITRLTLDSPQRGNGSVEETIHAIPSAGGFVRSGLTATYRDEDDAFNDNFDPIITRPNSAVYIGRWYVPPTETSITVVEVLPKPLVCAPNDVRAQCLEYVKLYNAGGKYSPSSFRIRTGVKGSSVNASNTAILSDDGISPGHYASYEMSLSDSGSYVWVEDAYGIKTYDATIVHYNSASSHDGQAWSRLSPNMDEWQWTKFPTPNDEPNRFNSGGIINQCSELKLSEIAANTNSQFVEVYSVSKNTINVSGCQIQTNRSTNISYVFPEGTTLAASQAMAVRISETGLTLTKTTSGTVFVLNSDGSVEVDARSYENLDENTSLALVGGTWLQTFLVTPNESNEYSEFPACDSGYVRNEETGRCNKIEAPSSLTACRADQYRSLETNRCRLRSTTSSGLKACAENQYRSTETNRCRLIATASGSLKPCAANQYRSPATNRCRLIASTASALKPCGSNQERNSATNRCRLKNVAARPAAQYPVEETGEAQSVLGWLAFASVGGLALVYGAWEWRYELKKGISGVISLFSGGGK